MLIRHWSRIKSDDTPKLCGVVEIGSSIHTACSGRWSVQEPCETFALDTVRKSEACDACWSFYVDQKAKPIGLVDLVDGTFSRVGLATRAYEHALQQHNAIDAIGFRAWLGPCPHNQSPVTRCAICASSPNNQTKGTRRWVERRIRKQKQNAR